MNLLYWHVSNGNHQGESGPTTQFPMSFRGYLRLDKYQHKRRKHGKNKQRTKCKKTVGNALNREPWEEIQHIKHSGTMNREASGRREILENPPKGEERTEG